MGPTPATLVWGLLLAAACIIAPAATADIEVPEPANLATIQAAIDGASSGDTVVIPAGTVDFAGGQLRLNKAGVSLRGAGSGSSVGTVFTGSVQTNITAPPADCVSGQGFAPMLCIKFSSPAAPIIIEGIRFKNAAQDSPPSDWIPAPTYPGPSQAINVEARGVAAGTPSIIR
jgi:hypothetical protein